MITSVTNTHTHKYKIIILYNGLLAQQIIRDVLKFYLLHIIHKFIFTNAMILNVSL